MKDKLKSYTPGALYRRWETWLKPSFVSALVVFGVFVGICGLLVWLGEPATDAEGSNLGSVLEAQAAMTAIFLVAMIFIVEAVQRREGLDDPLYELFLSKSWARWIFATAVWLLIGTALLYVFGSITGLIEELADARGDTLAISSLVIAAFLVLVFLLRALHVLRPERYRTYRQDAVLDQVRHGVRSQFQAQVSRSPAELLRQIRGIRNEVEMRATRVIERVADDTHQAVEQARLTEIREGMELLERICSTILEEIEEDGHEAAETDTGDDQQWFGHDNILSCMQRILRTAASSPASDSVLWAILRADVQKAQSFSVTPYRLEDNTRSGNDLFVQVILECMQSNPQAFAKLTKTGIPTGYPTPQESMLSGALWNALSRSSVAYANSRGNRLAKRMVAFIYDLASRSALEGDEERACALLWSFLPHAHGTIFADEGVPRYNNAVDRILRQATLSAIGYGVGVGNHPILYAAASWLKVGEIIETGKAHSLHLLVDRDVKRWSGGESMLSGGLWWLSSRMHSQPPPIEIEKYLRQREAESAILGYMWLLGMIHDGAGELELSDAVRSEFDRVWHLHGARLVAALQRASVGERQDWWSWCEAAYGGGESGNEQ